MKHVFIFPVLFLIFSNLLKPLPYKSENSTDNQDKNLTDQTEIDSAPCPEDLIQEIEILDKFFFFLPKSHGNEPVIGILLFNNTSYTISNIFFRAELKSIYNGMTWVEDEFGYTPEKWILPGETLYAEINFAYNWNWENPDIDDTRAELTIEVLDAYDTLGNMIFQMFLPKKDSISQ